MADMMAIVSKAVFETEAGKDPAVGSKLGMDRYATANKALAALAEDGGGKLYLVTVRPPDEKLWLVAILEKPKFNKTAWVAKPSTIGITDISSLKKKIKFESGKGISAAKGALGMSLQTPRALAAADVALLEAAAGTEARPTAEARPTGKFDKTLPPAKSGVAPASDRKTLLLQAIIADPDNLDARRIYADELLSHNDPRGEFIHVDLALAGRLSIRKREDLAKRAKELRKKYAKQWWPYKGSLRVRAGFVESVVGALSTIGSTAPKLLANEPASDFTVESFTKKEVDTLAKCVWLDQVRRLALRGELGDDGFAALIGIPRLADLESLNVTAAGIKKGTGQLGDKLGKLTSLVLTGNDLGAPGLAGLLGWKHLAKIERLFLSSCGLGNDDVAKLVTTKLPKLQKLTLSKNDLEAGIGAIIAGNAKNLPELRHLELIGTEAEDADAEALQNAKFANLTRIDLRQTEVESASDSRVRFDATDDE